MEGNKNTPSSPPGKGTSTNRALVVVCCSQTNLPLLFSKDVLKTAGVQSCKNWQSKFKRKS